MVDSKRALEEGSLEVTPTWAVALVCSVFVLASLGIERGLHYTGKWLKRHNQKSLFQALNKMKEELMLLGFISLLLTVFQKSIADICMPHSFVEHMLPCKLNRTELHEFLNESPKKDSRTEGLQRSHCLDKGKVPFVSREGLHQLHIFIFVMAIVHVVYSCLTLLLGRYKIHGWRAWEVEAQSEAPEQQPTNGAAAANTKFGRQRTFVRNHLHPAWKSSVFRSLMLCFFRQFGRSVLKTDYKTLRLGFIKNHNVKSNFDFHRYINRVLEDDFKKVVGISSYLWVFVVIFLLLNVNGWHTYFWIAFIPLLFTLVIGTKLQHIMMTLAMDIAEAKETAVVKPRNELFWFSRPKLILYLLHFVLFQNAFELAFFFWIWATFGFDSCFMENLGFVIVRLVIGIIVQVLCSYSTLPLYALVTQMGSQLKKAIFEEHVAEAILGWQGKVKERMRARRPPSGDDSARGSSTSMWTKMSTIPSRESEELEMSKHELEDITLHQIVQIKQEEAEAEAEKPLRIDG